MTVYNQYSQAGGGQIQFPYNASRSSNYRNYIPRQQGNVYGVQYDNLQQRTPVSAGQQLQRYNPGQTLPGSAAVGQYQPQQVMGTNQGYSTVSPREQRQQITPSPSLHYEQSLMVGNS